MTREDTVFENFVWAMLNRVYGRVSVEHLEKVYTRFTALQRKSSKHPVSFEERLLNLKKKHYATDLDFDVKDGYIYRTDLPEDIAESQSKYRYKEFRPIEVQCLMQDHMILTDNTSRIDQVLANPQYPIDPKEWDIEKDLVDIWTEVNHGKDATELCDTFIEKAKKRCSLSAEDEKTLRETIQSYIADDISVMALSGNSLNGSKEMETE